MHPCDVCLLVGYCAAAPWRCRLSSHSRRDVTGKEVQGHCGSSGINTNDCTNFAVLVHYIPGLKVQVSVSIYVADFSNFKTLSRVGPGIGYTIYRAVPACLQRHGKASSRRVTMASPKCLAQPLNHAMNQQKYLPIANVSGGFLFVVHVLSYQHPPPITRSPKSVSRVQPVKSSSSIFLQQIARDRRPMLVTPWQPPTLSSRRSNVCLAIHHNPTSVTCDRVS